MSNPVLVKIPGYEKKTVTPTREDLEVTRRNLGDPTKFQTGLVNQYGYVAFVDEAVHHATPYYGHRYVTDSDLKWYLEARHPDEFKEASTAYPKFANRSFWSSSEFSSYVNKGDHQRGRQQQMGGGDEDPRRLRQRGSALHAQ